MNLTVIANNSQEAALLTAFRQMDAYDLDFIVEMVQTHVEDHPRQKPVDRSHLRLVPTCRKTKK